MLVTVKDEYLKTLSKYDNAQIAAVFPEYYNEIRASIEKITDVVDQYKINKKVEEAVASDMLFAEELHTIKETSDQFLSMDVVNKLIQHLKTLRQKEPELIKSKKQARRSFFMEKLLAPIITAIISGSLVGLILSLL